MRSIEYLKGDATQARLAPGANILAHVVNDKGRWGKGFTHALDKRWAKPREDYLKAYRSYYNPLADVGQWRMLGMNIPSTIVPGHLMIIGMCAQIGVRSKPGECVLSYDMLRLCLEKLGRYAVDLNAAIHMPRIGAGLAGGDWQVVEQIITETLCALDLNVFVYDL